MTNRIPLIVNAGAAQIQEISSTDVLQVPGNLTANVVQTDNYQYANGTPISFSGSYGNSNVAAYLPTYTGNLAAVNYIQAETLAANANVVANNIISTTETVSGNLRAGNLSAVGNVVATGVKTDNYMYANGTPFVSSNYGDSNVGTYLDGVFTGDIVPASNNTQSLGNATNQWADIWVSNATIYLNAVPLSVSNVGVLQFNGNDLVTSGPNVINTGNVETTGNVVAGNLVIASGGELQFPDGSTQSTAYGNANVEAYLPTSNAIISINSNAANTDGNVANLTSALGNTNSELTDVSNAVITLSQATTDAFANTNSNVANLTTDLANTNSDLGNLTITVTSQGNAIANLQGATYANANVANYLPTYTGNISSNILTANILVGDGGNIANITGANVTGEVAVANTVSNPSQPNITALGTIVSLNADAITANTLQLAGNAQFDGNVYFAANVTIPGNIIQISGNSGNFYGNPATGFGALYAGIPAGFTPLINEVVQMAGNDNSYVQTTLRNLNAGSQATGDFVITADNGSDTTNHIDLGIASSSYNGALANNSLGTSLYPNDGYLYTRGNVSGGNLVLGSNQANGVVRIIANGGSNISDVVATFSANGLSILGDISTVGVASPAPVINGFSFRGPNVSAAGNVTGGNVLTGGIVSATGNVTGNYLLGNGYYIPNVNALQVINGTSNVTVPTTNGNVVVTVAGTATSTFDTAGNFSIPGNIITPHGMLAEGNIYTESWLVANNQGVVATQVNAGNISATGNITGSYILGNGSQLTGLPAGYSDSNVVTLLTSYGSNVISTTGNVSAGYFIGDGSLLTGLLSSYSDSNVSTYLASGNNSAGYSTTGNVTANYLQTASGSSSNITGANYINANYFVGDGSLLTNITVSTTYNNSNVVTLLSNFGSNVVSTTGNVTASYVLADGSQLTNLPTPAPVIGTTASGATITPTGSSTQYNVTALAETANFAAPSGSPADGQKLTIRILDNGTPQTLTWNAIYQVIGTTLPTTTVASKYTYVGIIYNAQDSTWDVVSVAQQA